ncbi:MAG: hypothetical protein A2X31_03735 [Elusimicrobia bacterium GWB2_63_22]|nr:MAG: hypothetical protein A2X31_03735 [Elusimicrobia bacterium GWB2_63_22]
MEYTDKNGLAGLEKALVARFQGGDTAAFSGLADLYKDRLHQFILCLLGPDREAEDIAQEAFVQIYKSLPSFRGTSGFGTWAYAVTRNVCRRRLRERGRDAVLFTEERETAADDVPQSGPTQELALESAETRALIRAEIAALSPVHRSVIFLSCWERLSYAEMAEALEIPVGTVRSRLHNALAALAARLKVLAEEEKI